MKYLKLLIVLFVSVTFSAFAMSSTPKWTPQQTVINFISDYEQWNEEATQNLSEDTGFQAKDEYIKLLNKYCTQSTSRIGYDVYGQYSLHIADGEKILSTTRNGKEVIIKTGVSSRFGDTDADMDYFEYHLVLNENKYLIEEVYQLSKSGKKTKTL
ncbi:RhsIA family immunity protein [Enterobacter asburiae]|nr:RhsIA family immunity protein [Enterobacter asburiae]